MANEAPAWLTAVPCRRSEALHDAAPRGVGLSDLSSRDKRELASLAAASLASTLCVLVVGTLMVPPGPVLNARPLSLALALAAPPRAAGSLPLSARAARTASARGSRAPAPPTLLASTFAAEPVATSPSARSLNPVEQIADVDLPSSSSRKTAAPGPLKRILFGSGQYRVQPFPTISEQ